VDGSHEDDPGSVELLRDLRIRGHAPQQELRRHLVERLERGVAERAHDTGGVLERIQHLGRGDLGTEWM
jgi:hypothetical protein